MSRNPWESELADALIKARMRAMTNKLELKPVTIVTGVEVKETTKVANKLSRLYRGDKRLLSRMDFPENYLHPTKQIEIAKKISFGYKSGKTVILVTGSPYILSAINNMILAWDVIKLRGAEWVREVFDPSTAIRYEDVIAYNVSDEEDVNIMDSDCRIIGGSEIDEVSETLGAQFDFLLTLQVTAGGNHGS